MNVNYEELETVLEKLTSEESRTVLRFAEFLLQQRPVAVDARTARRKASTWLVRDVGNLLMGGEPEYVPGERPVWRVPVLVAHGRRGCATFYVNDPAFENAPIPVPVGYFELAWDEFGRQWAALHCPSGGGE